MAEFVGEDRRGDNRKMIKKQTVLILGAGASHHLGFPLGKRLIEDIYRLVFDKSKGWSLAGTGRIIENEYFSNAQLLERFLELSNYKKADGQRYTHKDIEEFADRLFQAQPTSIDFFLEKNPQYRLLGKLCIIFCISRFEDQDSWQYRPSSDPIKLKEDFPDFGWYSYLWHRLVADCKDFKDLLSNKITIITFNYDRSLEFYLFRAIKAFFNVEDDEAMDVFNTIRIKHVYGRLGKLFEEMSGISSSPLLPEEVMLETAPYTPWEIRCFYRLMGNTGEYGMAQHDFNEGSTMGTDKARAFLTEKFNKVVKDIQTFYEGNTAEQKKEFLNDLLFAEQIYFLGFGYHEENFKVLGLPAAGFDLDKLSIKGTAINMTEEEKKSIERRLSKVFKSKDFLKKYGYIHIYRSLDGLDKSEPCIIKNFLRNVEPLI